MRIFITGIAGFLGSHLADALLRDGHVVGGVDSLIGGYEDNVPDGVQIWWKAECNVLSCLNGYFERFKPEIVFHCAALAYEGLSVFSPHVVTQSIVGASTSVFSASIAAGVKRIVHCSSMARYGRGNPPFLESDRPEPQDPYGIGKLCAEQMLRNLCETHGVEFAIAVPHNIVGPRQKYDDPYRNVASIMINRALQGKPIIVYGDGSQQRCFSYVDDCISCLKKMAFQDNVVGEVINIGPDEEPITINDLAQMVKELTGEMRTPVQYMPGRPQEVRIALCSSNKARDLLGYETTVNLRDAIGAMVDYVRARGVRPFDYHLPLEIVNDLTPQTWKERLF
jgi:UDP-glucose 4-epimerase